jgi:hypothetical protein
MSSNTIIELRQQDGISIDANGSYECQLSKDVIIENGDMLTVNKIFIDSVKEGDINIPNDLTLTINSGVYFLNWDQLTGNEFKIIDGTSLPTYPTPSFKRFIPYVLINSGDLSGCSNYTSFQFLIPDDRWEGVINITYGYIDWYGNEQHITTTVPPSYPRVYKNAIFTDSFNIVAQNGSVKYLYSNYTGTNSWIPKGAQGTAIDVSVLQPFTFKTDITLPAGVYSPLQLTTYITQQLTQTNLNANAFNPNMTKSNFLFTIDDFNDGKPSPDGRVDGNGDPIILSAQTIFISDDKTISTTFPNAVNPAYIGASQIALEVDENNRVNWNYLHMPMYDSTTGTNISVRYLLKGLTAGDSVYGCAQNSGIYFQSLIAKDTVTNKAVDFWSGQLGLDLSTLCVGTTQVTNKYGFPNIINLSNPLIEGVNITNGFYGLDSAIIKGGTWATRNPVPNTIDGLCSTINSTVQINATATITELLNKFSHYILQTDLGFQNNNYIGQKWYRNINGIITKYYSYGSYTFSETDAGIQYIHTGAPIFLKSIKVRLLKSDKTIDGNLGPDNTVILQLIKGGGQIQPSTAMPKRA